MSEAKTFEYWLLVDLEKRALFPRAKDDAINIGVENMLAEWE